MNEKKNFDYKRLHPFKWYILENFPFLEDSIDVLTNYQLFCKLGEMYNKQVDAINTLGVQVEGLTDWFDNLNVQDEINNKLDDMAESGELEEIISAYINTNALICFDTISDMKSSENLVNGSYAKTLGYHSINDGGMSTYKIRTITNDDVVDEASIVALNDNTLVAELIPYNHQISLKQFGCYGDGTHDDSTNVQKAIDYFTSKKDIKLISDKSTYLISNSIEIEDDLEADYYTNKEIDFSLATFTTENNINVFELSATWLEIKIGAIIKEVDKYENGTAFLLKDKAWHNNIDIRTIMGYQYGIKMLPTLGIMHNNITWTYLNNRINIYGDINGSYINQNKFTGGNIGVDSTETTSYGIYITDSSAEPNYEFNGNLFERVAFEVVGYPIYLEHCQFSKFIDFRFNERQLTNYYITCHDCNNMYFETNDALYFNEPSYAVDDFTLDNADIGNWNANCNKYKINLGKQALKELPNNSTTHYFTIINNQIIYLDYARKNGKELYLEATQATTPLTVNTSTPVTYFNCVLGAGNIELTLPQRYAYNDSLYDEIVINLHHLVSPNKMIVKDYGGTTIFDSSNYTFTAGMNIDKKFIIKTTGKINTYAVISA